MAPNPTCGIVVLTQLCVESMKATVTMTHIALGTFNVEMTIVLVFHRQQLTAVSCLITHFLLLFQQQLHLLHVTMRFLDPLELSVHLDGQISIHPTVINAGK